jgi:hypothetical protein
MALTGTRTIARWWMNPSAPQGGDVAGPAGADEGNATMHITRRTTRHLSGGLVATGLLAAALMGGSGAAQAQGGGGGDKVRVSGTCSAASQQELTAKQDDGRIDVEVEVDSNKVGQTWQVSLADNGSRFLSASRVTKAPSGSFEIGRTVSDHAGSDRITALATNVRTGERCSAALVVRG